MRLYSLTSILIGLSLWDGLAFTYKTEKQYSEGMRHGEICCDKVMEELSYINNTRTKV